MGFKNTLLIKHATDGYEFSLDVDHDADALGVKVLIWELQKVPITSQRLVFNGKEINDSVKLNQFGIIDGDTLFLIETVKFLHIFALSNNIRNFAKKTKTKQNLNIYRKNKKL